MHSYHNKLLQNHCYNYLFHSAQFILTPQYYQLLRTCFNLEMTFLREQVLVHLLPKSVVYTTRLY